MKIPLDKPPSLPHHRGMDDRVETTSDKDEEVHELTRVDQLALEVHEREGEEVTLSPIEQWHQGAEPRHHMIARFVALGVKPVEIAKRMDTTVENVRSVMSSPLFQAVVKEMEKGFDDKVVEARRMLFEAAPRAAQTKIDLLSAIDPGVRQTASSDILKGTGAIKQEGDNGSGKGPTFNIKAEQVQLINTTLKEIEDAKNNR